MVIVSDNGTELISLAILRWTQERPVEWHYIAPGEPTDDAFVVSFNGHLRLCATTTIGLWLPLDERPGGTSNATNEKNII